MLLIGVTKNAAQILLPDWNDYEVDVRQQQRQQDCRPDLEPSSGDAEIFQR